MPTDSAELSSTIDLAHHSFFEWWSVQPESIQTRVIEEIGPKFFERWNWRAFARPDQLAPPGDWRIWLIQMGRGGGKTRAAAEWVRWKVETGQARRVALVGRTGPDCRHVMIEGVSGMMSISRPDFRPMYEPSKRQLTWPNGAIATTYSAEEPDQLRGPEHDLAWADELASWKLVKTLNNDGTAWDMLRFGLRLGNNPQTVVSTTPKPVSTVRNLHTNRELLKVHITRGSTMDNAANLAPAALIEFKAKYGGTRLGKQELEGELLEDFQGALWTRAMIDKARETVKPPDFERVVVAIDPSVTSTDDSDETGIVTVARGKDKRYYVLQDDSFRASPGEWAKKAVTVYREFNADRIIGEANNGGDLVERNLRTEDKNIPFSKVWASRGKVKRAEPIASLYEQGVVTHVDSSMYVLEDQLCALIKGGGYALDGSPDRADALVWALTDLLDQPGPPRISVH